MQGLGTQNIGMFSHFPSHDSHPGSALSPLSPVLALFLSGVMYIPIPSGYPPPSKYHQGCLHPPKGTLKPKHQLGQGKRVIRVVPGLLASLDLLSPGSL